MITMCISVLVSAIKSAKDSKSNNYVDFLCWGGSVSVPVDKEQLEKIKPFVGLEALAVFEMRTISTILYERPVTVFIPSRFVTIKKSE